jgi:hypothetical protein
MKTMLIALLALGAVTMACAVLVAQDESGDKQVMLEGLNTKPMWITQMGCLIGCAEYLKTDASPEWIYGGSGHAFALNIHEALCPSGPTAWRADKCNGLAGNLGLTVEDHLAFKGGEDFAAKQEEIWQIARSAIDAKTPCFGWELGVPEWYIICGYDKDGNYLYRDFGGAVAETPYTKLGASEIGVASLQVVKKGKATDDRTAVREALVFALNHGAGKDSQELYHTGLSGYDTWIKALQDKKVVETKDAGFGLAYNAQCWAECRQYAVKFLVEAKKRIGDDDLNPLFDEAIKHYKVVSENLDVVAKTFPFNFQDQATMTEQIKDAQRREKAVEALKAAREAEEAGLKTLAKIAVALGTEGIDPDEIGKTPQGE